MTSSLEKEFDEAMMDIFRRADAEANYKATRFLQMLNEHRGLATAQLLLHSSNVSEGYTALWERGRLDLTVEALILQSKWGDLFEDDERELAKQRLEQYGFDASSIK